MGRTDLYTFTFSSRMLWASSAAGGSIATSAMSWKMWFWIMSRVAPLLS